MTSEDLFFDQTPLFRQEGESVRLFSDKGEAGPVFPFMPLQSAISFIPKREENQRLTWFRKRMERLFVLSPDPPRMAAVSETEHLRPTRHLHNLASWLRHLSQESVDTLAKVRDGLREVIPGFGGLGLKTASESARVLKVDFLFSGESAASGARKYTLPFDQLSEGQRNLVALFVILEAVVGRDTTVCLDEPDNYLALREIQPWVMRLRDQIDEHQGQCLLISHHPEVINYLAAKHGMEFTREDAGPARARRFESDNEELMTPAELIARGWK